MNDELILLIKEKAPYSVVRFSRRFSVKIRKRLLIVVTGNTDFKIDEPVKVVYSDLKPEELVEDLTPFMFILPTEKPSVIEHIFFKPWSEDLAEKFPNRNFLLVPPESEAVNKVLVYVDWEHPDENYIGFLNELLTPLRVPVTLVTTVDEEDEVLPLLEKEFPQWELDELLNHMVGKALAELGNKLQGIKVLNFLLLKGNPGVMVPMYAFKNGYDLLVAPQRSKHREEFIENSKIPLALVVGRIEE
jgi:hypothetical protein